MKKTCVIFVLVFVMLAILAGCNNKGPAGPLGVNKIQLTFTPTCTPDANFKVFVNEAGTPMPNVLIQAAPKSATYTVEALTDSSGMAWIKVNSGGEWQVKMNGFSGYDSVFNNVEPLKTPVYNVNLGKQTLNLELISGSASLGIAPSTLVYRLTYNTLANRLYNLEFKGLPDDLTVTASALQVKNNNDQVTFSIDVPKSYETIKPDGVYVYVSATSLQGVSKIKSKDVEVKRNWAFNVKADVKFAKTFIFEDPEVTLGQSAIPYSSSYVGKKTKYWIGAKNFVPEIQNFVLSGNMKVQYVSHELWGEIPQIYDNYTGLSNIEYSEGYYQVLIRAESNAGYDWVRDHNNSDGSMTLRFYDDKDFSVIRSFHVPGSMGTLCGHYHQVCFGLYFSAFDKCGNYPNTTGCVYAPIKMKRVKEANIYGE